MYDIILLLIFVLYILITTIHLIRMDVLVGGVYFFLFIYSIFAMIGYCFYPELSILVKAYFGKEYFYQFYIFNFLSFICFYLLFIFVNKYGFRFSKLKVVKYKGNIFSFYLLTFLLLFYGYNYFYIIANYSMISYGNASNPDFLDSQDIFYKIYAISFKSLTPLALIFYLQFRLKLFFNGVSILNKSHLRLLFIFSIVTLFFFSYKMGSRTDIVAFIIGAFIFEFNMGLDFKKILRIVSISFVILSLLLILEEIRLEGNVEEKDLTLFQTIIFKDYYVPAHMLFTIMHYNYIDPLFVLKSNICNSLVGLNVDYLQMPITELINPGIANRSQGYAFYLFSEGFLFMGFFGFIYNALMLFTGLKIWKILYNSNNHYFNLIIYSLLTTQIANLSRGQSSYFLKDILVFIIPMLFIIFISSGLTFSLKRS